jgi:zinc protease
VQPGALTRFTLANGARGLVIEDRRAPRVVFSVSVRRGAASVPVERAGLAVYLTELMKRGAGDRDALALASHVDSLGATLGVGSGWDSTGVVVAGLARDRDALLDILADVVLRPRFDTVEAEKARDQQLSALRRAVDSPATLAGWHTARVLYAGHRYGLPRSGTPESVATLDADSARSLHAQWFVPGDAVLSATGAIDPDRVASMFEEHFGAWPEGPRAAEGPSPPERVPAARKLVVIDRPDLAQAHITVAHEGIARTYPNRIAADLLNLVLGGGGFSSRLMTVLRSERGLTYGVGSGFHLRRMPGPFAVSTSTRVEEARAAVDAILGELERMRREPPTADELQAARALSVGSFALSLETSAAVMAGLVDLEIYDLPRDSLDTFRGRVRATTVEETARQARERLHPERAAIVVVGPAAALVPALEGLGPVEVTTP